MCLAIAGVVDQS